MSKTLGSHLQVKRLTGEAVDDIAELFMCHTVIGKIKHF